MLDENASLQTEPMPLSAAPIGAAEDEALEDEALETRDAKKPRPAVWP